MRKIITTLLIVVSTNLSAQDWAEKVAKRFYSTIDSSRKLDCCDKTSSAISIDYVYSTFELPIQSTDDIINRYYNQALDSVIIDDVVKDLVASYNKIPNKYKNNFTKTCFNIDTKTEVNQKYNSDLYFVEGKVHFTFSFQTEKPIKRNIFKRLFNTF